jgi:DNA-binding transcriptional ArsR family regulator
MPAELDARTLRGLAHPLRMRILGILRTGGPATATGLAARLGESTGTTSWHLRQLAESGLIVEDTGRGNRRERWWRAAHEYTAVRFEKLIDEPENAAAVNAFLHEAASLYYRNATAFIAEVWTWNREWVQAADFSDDELSLTPGELTSLTRELDEVIRRYKRDRRPGDEPVVVQIQSFPRRRS